MSKAARRDRLEQSTYKLNTLLGMAQTISEVLRPEDLVERFRNILNNELGIDRVLLYRCTEDGQWELLLRTNCPDDIVNQIDIERDLLPCDEVTFVAATDNYMLLDLDMIIPIEQNGKISGYVLIGDTHDYEKGLSATIRHLNFVQTLAIIIFVGIENLRLFHQAIEQESMRKEMELASRMQSMLIPSATSMPKFPNIDIASYYSPHFEVGGDYYDVIPLSPTELGFCIADVSGKGISAALLMSNFQANLRALFTSEIPLPDFVTRLNSRIMATAQGEKFITLFIGRYNCNTRTLEYINAGHNPPIMYNINNQEIKYLEKGCVGIGMLDEIPLINVGQQQIEPNTKIVCYTDGLVERAEGEKVLYDTKPIVAHLANADSIADNIARLTEMRGINTTETTTEIFDDISILGFEFK